jgi:outer membrane biosynthesis protein TonB
MLETVAYILLGLFVIFGPGFLLSLVLFPKLGDFDFWKRVAVSFGLGVMLSIYIGAILSRPQFKALTLAPFTEASLILFVILAVVAYLRKGMAVPAAYARAVMRTVHKPKPPTPTPPIHEQPKPSEQPAPEQPKSAVHPEGPTAHHEQPAVHHEHEHQKPPTPPDQEQQKHSQEQH